MQFEVFTICYYKIAELLSHIYIITIITVPSLSTDSFSLQFFCLQAIAIQTLGYWQVMQKVKVFLKIWNIVRTKQKLSISFCPLFWNFSNSAGHFKIIWTEIKNIITDICKCPPVPLVLLGLMICTVLITHNSWWTQVLVFICLIMVGGIIINIQQEILCS